MIVDTATTSEPSIEALFKKFRNSPCGASLLPMEAELSLPVASRSSEGSFVTALILRTRPRDDGPGRVLLAPLGRLTLRYPDGWLARYDDFRFANPLRGKGVRPGDPIGFFPHPTIATISPKEYLEYRLLLSRRTLDLLAEASFDDELKRLWGLLMEPALAPYYWLISPPYLRRFLAPDNHDHSTGGLPHEEL
jgi:hypothetical protein